MSVSVLGREVQLPLSVSFGVRERVMVQIARIARVGHIWRQQVAVRLHCFEPINNPADKPNYHCCALVDLCGVLTFAF